MDEFIGLIVGGALIYLAVIVLKGVIIWLYQTFKLVARVGVGIAGSVLTFIITQSLFGIGFDNLTFTGIGTGLVLAFLFPNASVSG